MNLTIDEAKTYMVQYHMINTNQSLSIEDVFNKIKSIQYDPLNVVGTNPELVLQSRIKGFQKQQLRDDLYINRTLIDGWDKQMCIYQTKFVPQFNLVRAQRAKAVIGTAEYLELDFEHLLEDVYNIIKENGPILSSKIKLGGTRKHPWGHTKASSAAIGYLFHGGKIGVESRNNTQKKFDIFDRVHPGVSRENPFLSESEFIEFHLLRRIQALGLVWNKSSVAFSGLHIEKKATRTKYLQVLLQKNLIQEISITGQNTPFYIPTGSFNEGNNLLDTISIIAPLDNLIWDRALIKELFQFDYKWEVYVPKDKRKYGYYVLPLLKGNEFIGRVSFHKQRNNDPITIEQLFLEPHIKFTKKLEIELDRCFKKFATYLNAKSVTSWVDKVMYIKE